MKTGVTEITITTLFMGVAFILFLITLLNQAVRRVFGVRTAMTQQEMLVLYAMLTMSSSVAGIGNLGFFTPFLVAPWRFDAAGSRPPAWLSLLPAWIAPRDPAVIKGFFEGNSTFFQAAVLRAWLLPLTLWAVFFCLLLWALLCLAIMVRHRWMDEERLTFPVVALPLEMTQEDAPLYRNRLMWIGFAIPAVLHTLNTLAGMYPTLPSFPINTARQGLDGLGRPLTGLGSIMLLLHPCGVGFGYLVNTDVLFSLWFFFFLKKFLNLLGMYMNWRDPGPDEYGDNNPQFPFTGYQAWGAWLTIGLVALKTGWPYFKAYFHRALDGDPEGKERGEPLTARQALFGFLFGFAALCGIIFAMGAPLWLPIVFLGIYALLMVALSRLEAETAVLSPLIVGVAPQNILATTLGTGNLSRNEVVQMATLSWFNSDYRAAPMPQQLQAFVAARRAGIGNLAPLTAVLMLATIVGVAAALVWDLQMYYANGAATAHVNGYRLNMARVPYWTLSGWLSQPKPPNVPAITAMAVGSAVTLLLSYLRTRFIGFPLSPSAYVLSTTVSYELFWLDLFLAWVIKSLFLRFGGIKLYRVSLAFFLGLILGDFVTGAAWSLFGTFTGLSVFRTFPN